MAIGRTSLKCLLPALLALVCAAAAAAPPVPEYELKAAFLYNFALFVDWPGEGRAEGSPTLPLCVIGRDPFGPALDVLEGKAVRAQKIEVRRLDWTEGAAECRILFIAASEQGRLARILGAVAGRPVLTVADSEDWLDQGVMINLSRRQARLAFDINLGAARQAGLRISSKLLRLASGTVGK